MLDAVASMGKKAFLSSPNFYKDKDLAYVNIYDQSFSWLNCLHFPIRSVRQNLACQQGLLLPIIDSNPHFGKLFALSLISPWLNPSRALVFLHQNLLTRDWSLVDCSFEICVSPLHE
jgi:hypothetical protein